MVGSGYNQLLNYPSNEPGSYIDFSGGQAGIAITSHGSDWYWAVTAVMMTSSLAFLGLAFLKPRTQRVFHYITAAITMVASVAYFSMASNIGWAPTTVEYIRSSPKVAGTVRQVFYVRYVDWAITTPLLLMDLLLTAGLPWPSVLFTILMDEIMIVTGLIGALVYSSYKWGYFTFGCVALFYIGYVLIFEARLHANHIGKDVGRVFIICGGWTFLLWCLYPIAWGVCEGGNVISPDSEAVFYGVLDIMAKPVFGALLIWGHRNIDPARLGLVIHDYADDKPGVDNKVANESTNDYGRSVTGTTGQNGTHGTHAAVAPGETTV